MNRRGFLGSILALAAAPAIVRAESLMRTFVRRESGLLVPDYSIDGLRALISTNTRSGGCSIKLYVNGNVVSSVLIPECGVGVFEAPISEPLYAGDEISWGG